MLRDHADAVEADLARFYNIDLRDRWRGGLTLRQLFVRVRHLPPDSAVAAVARDRRPHWTVESHLLDDLRMSLTGIKDKPSKPHPDRPTGRASQSPERAKKLKAARSRAQVRRRAREAAVKSM